MRIFKNKLVLAIAVPFLLSLVYLGLLKFAPKTELINTVSLILLLNIPISAISFLIMESHNVVGTKKISIVLLAELLTLSSAIFLWNSFNNICLQVCPTNINFLRQVFSSEMLLYFVVALLLPLRHFSSLFSENQ